MSQDYDDEDDYRNSARFKRYERFIALGGDVPIQQRLRDLARFENHEHVNLKDSITNDHRALVADLVAAGLSVSTIATIFGISPRSLETFFPYEIGTGFEFAKANLVQSLYAQGVAGDRMAAIDWLRHHNRSDWRSKTDITGKDGGAVEVDVSHKGDTEKAKAWVQDMIGAMMGDQKLKRPEKTITGVMPGEKAAKAKKPKPGKQVKKPREEIEDDE